MRIVRLYPLYGLAIAFSALKAGSKLAAHAPSDFTARSLLFAFSANSVMLPADVGLPSIIPLDGPGWSLFFEWLINVLYGVALFRVRSLWLAVLAGTAALILTYVGCVQGRILDLGSEFATFGYGFARVTFGFLLGVLIARSPIPAARRRLTGWAMALTPALLLMLFVPVPPSLGPARDVLGVLLVSPAMVLIGSRLDVPRWWRRPYALLGDISYPLYVLHYPIFLALVAASRPRHLSTAPLFALGLVVPVAAAVLAERFYDQPLRRWLSMRLNTRESAPPQVIGQSAVPSG